MYIENYHKLRITTSSCRPRNGNFMLLNCKKSQHGCVRWAQCEHLTSPCYDFTAGGLRGGGQIQLTNTFLGTLIICEGGKPKTIFSPFRAFLTIPNNDHVSLWRWLVMLGILLLNKDLPYSMSCLTSVAIFSLSLPLPC